MRDYCRRAYCPLLGMVNNNGKLEPCKCIGDKCINFADTCSWGHEYGWCHYFNSAVIIPERYDQKEADNDD